MAENKEDTNKFIAQFQIMQQQLQNLMIQKESLRLNIMEIDQTLEELGKSKEKNAYKITGNVMISKPVEEVKKELGETKDALNVRMESLGKNEKKLTDKLKEMQEKLKEMLK
jgi:prefoldin beta subunit